MSTSLDYFSRGLERAFAQRAKQRVEQARQANTEQVDNVATNTNTSTNTDKLSTAGSTTDSLSDDQYQTTIIQLMVNHIKQKKETN